MSGSGTEKRQHATSVRCAQLRRQGLTLSQIAKETGVPRGNVYVRVQLGERLLSLGDSS